MTNEVEERQLSVKKVRMSQVTYLRTQLICSVCPRRDYQCVLLCMCVCVTHSGAHMRYLCTYILCV